MSIKVLLADDSHVMLEAIRKRLAEDSRIRLVGAVSSFASMMQMISDFKPEVLILDLHFPEERHFTPDHFTPDFVKSQLGSVPHTLAVSLSNDAEAKALSVSYGAESLLDKMKLYDQMIPAIMGCCQAHEIRYADSKHPNRC
jgi:DNA-binding NarL/FixJ family response regulator